MADRVRLPPANPCNIACLAIFSLWHYRKIDKAGLSGRVPHALRCFLIVARLRIKNVWHEGLRIAVVKREEARLHLDHDAVSGFEDMICRWQAQAIEQRLVRCDG